MKKLYVYALAVAFLAVPGLIVSFALADQDDLGQRASANFSRSCSFAGKTAQTVSVSSTAATSAVTGVGVVRLYCTSASHFVQWVSGVTGATSTTSATPIAATSPEYILSDGGKFSIIRSSADGTCFITDCK